MNICLSRFGLIGTVVRDFQSWRDTTIIGWFTTIRVIKYHFIISLKHFSAHRDVEFFMGIIGTLLGLLILGFVPGVVELVGHGNALFSFVGIFLVFDKNHVKGVGT
jgi:hypothetical protein